jgi:hypothetical protein
MLISRARAVADFIVDAELVLGEHVFFLSSAVDISILAAAMRYNGIIKRSFG